MGANQPKKLSTLKIKGWKSMFARFILSLNVGAENVVVQQNSNQVDQNFENFIRQAFMNVAKNGRLYKDKFNEALAVLENFNIKRLRYTPLGERLFNIFDKV